MTMHGPDFMRDYQGFAQQAWDAWSRSLQPQGAGTPFFSKAPTPPTIDETLERSLDGFRSYLQWLQSAAGSGLAQGGGDWQQQLQSLFGAGQPASAQAFGGIGSPSVQGFGEQWQRWMQAAQPAGFGELRAMLQTPAFGYHREQQEQQQALQRAMLDHMEASRRYQELMLKAQLEGADRLQKRLAERSQSQPPLESLKALYDLWIDCAEEAYAEIALSDEFRKVYGEQVNTQMRVRKLQKAQLEEACRQLGMPTASEVASLGQRLQEVRRELRQLQQQVASRPSAAKAAGSPPVAKAAAPAATRKRASKSAVSGGSARSAKPKGAAKAAKTATKTATKSSARASSRKRR